MTDIKVVLKIKGTKLVMDLEPAMALLKGLWNTHMEELVQDYEKDPVSGNYGYVYRIKTIEQGDLAMEYLSPANYVGWQLNGDTK